MTSPQVSIIIPAFNTSALIARCLDSVFSQTFTGFEVIVVNDGSPDTPEMEKALLPYMDRIVYIKQENKRAAGARNTAIRQSLGDFLAFLDSDDFWFSQHLKSQMELFQKEPFLDLVYANGLVRPPGDAGSGWRFMQRCPSEGEATFSALVVERCQIPISTVVVRKKALIDAGFFDESLDRCDDYDMWLRIAFYGGRIAYTDNLQICMSGKRPGSLGDSAAKMADAYCFILEKVSQQLPLSGFQQNVIKRRLIEFKALYNLEEAKRQMKMRKFQEARQLFSDANRHLRLRSVSLAAAGLAIAPNTTSTLINMWSRLRNGRSN